MRVVQASFFSPPPGRRTTGLKMQFQTKLHKRRRASVEKVCCAVCGGVFAGSNPARTVPTCCLPALPSVKTTKTHAHMRGSVVSCSRGRSKHHLKYETCLSSRSCSTALSHWRRHLQNPAFVSDEPQTSFSKLLL